MQIGQDKEANSAVIKQFFLNMRAKYKPNVVWKWQAVSPPIDDGVFGLAFENQSDGVAQKLCFSLAENDARALGEILSDHFARKDAGDPSVYQSDAGWPEILQDKDSAAVSTAIIDVGCDVSLSYRQQQAKVIGLQARLKSLRAESPNVAGATAALLRVESGLLTLQSERILAH
jgi:hypothetical protein